MNRFIKALLLALSFTMVISAVALAATWDFKYPTTATDNTSTTRTYYPVILGYGGQQLIDNEKILSSGLDTNMQIVSTDVDYMMSTDQVTAVISTLPSNGSVNLDLYTGYSPVQSGFPVIIGDSGNITVANHASMDYGDNWTLTFTNVILNTDAGSNKNLWYEADTLEIYIDDTTFGTVNVTVPAQAATYTTIAPNGAGDYTNIPGLTGAATHWQAVLTNDGDTSYVYENTASWLWDAYNLGTPTIPDDAVITSVQTYILVRAAYANTAEYRSGLRLSGSETFGTAHSDSTTTYHAFTDTVARPGGGDWSASDLTDLQVLLGLKQTGQTPYCTQVYVIINYYIPAYTVSVTGIDTDEYSTVTISENTTHLEIDIDGTSDSTAFSNSLVDNDNSILMMQGNSFVKADSIELEIDGVAVATYAPTEMLSGATLEDETGSNDGTITWGSNTGVEILYGAMESSIESEGGSPVTGNATLPTAFMPATWFAMGENIENLPFYDMVYNAVSSMDFPDVTEGVQTIYLIVIYGTSLLAFLLIVLFTRSALLGFTAMEMVLFIGSSMTIIPMWIPVAILLVGIAIMFLYRQVAY